MITIFFATSMTRADLPSWTKYILIAYVVVYLVFYALFTVNEFAIMKHFNFIVEALFVIVMTEDNEFYDFFSQNMGLNSEIKQKQLSESLKEVEQHRYQNPPVIKSKI